MTRQNLRTTIRDKRRALTQEFQQTSSTLLKERLSVQPDVIKAKRIALYLANDGELDPLPFIHWCWANNKKVYLPVIHPFSKGNLLFLAYTNKTPMIKNCYGISEPTLDVTQVCPVEQLDVLFTPLVAFDSTGARLGMGGGFYDRTLASCEHKKNITIVGLAHDCQQVGSIPIESWDMPLPSIITPTKQSFYT